MLEEAKIEVQSMEKIDGEELENKIIFKNVEMEVYKAEYEEAMQKLNAFHIQAK